jgi:type II secretory pathway pseudopilin PulG
MATVKSSLLPGGFAMSPSQYRHNKKATLGFTLVELLTVIAILLFLAALLMPTLSRIRETAKATKCMSNMRQIAMATFTYAADNDGFAPYDDECMRQTRNWVFVKWSHETADGSGYQATYPKNKWFAEYLPGGEVGKMNPIGYCPKGGRFGEIGPVLKDAAAIVPNCSYAINPDLTIRKWFYENFDSGGVDRRCVPLNQVFNPAKVCLWVEANRDSLWPRGELMSGRHFSKERIPCPIAPVVAGKLSYRGLGKLHVVYVDQHIQTIKLPEQEPEWNSQFFNHTQTSAIHKYPHWE